MIRHVLIAAVKGYRFAISPLLPPRCRFYPSCSHYALQALEQHGALKGSALTVIRICKCHPFHPGGLDPVPPPRAKRRDDSSDETAKEEQS